MWCCRRCSGRNCGSVGIRCVRWECTLRLLLLWARWWSRLRHQRCSLWKKIVSELLGDIDPQERFEDLDLHVKSAILSGAVSSSSATRRTISKTKVIIPNANIVIAPVFSLLLSCNSMTSRIGTTMIKRSVRMFGICRP